MLYLKCYRERVAHALYKGTNYHKLMLSWPCGQLIHWRWSSLADVCAGLVEREQALRTNWSLNKFLRGTDPDGQEGAQESDQPRKRQKYDLGKIWTQFDAAMVDPWFWAYVRFLHLVDGQISKISSWTEGCSCHGFRMKGCPLKGRRCHDFASGEFQAFLQRSLEKTRNAFLICCSGLSQSAHQAALHTEFRLATEVLLAEATLKTAHWRASVGIVRPSVSRCAASP